MPVEHLYDDPEWLIFLVLVGLLLLANEIGHLAGRRKGPSAPGPALQQFSDIQSALAGLFALLLGFTFAMALSRFELRRQMIVREANAIGTAALRAGLLPSGQRAETSALFRRYVEARVEEGNSPNLDTPRQRALDAEAARLQDELWKRAAGAAEADSRSVPAGLLLQAMNELIDAKGERDAALANHVPESVLLMLFGFAVLTTAMLGYGSGLSNVRARVPAAILTLLISLVLLVIVDLDRPGRGLIRVHQPSMIDLQKSLEGAK